MWFAANRVIRAIEKGYTEELSRERLRRVFLQALNGNRPMPTLTEVNSIMRGNQPIYPLDAKVSR